MKVKSLLACALKKHCTWHEIVPFIRSTFDVQAQNALQLPPFCTRFQWACQENNLNLQKSGGLEGSRHKFIGCVPFLLKKPLYLPFNAFRSLSKFTIGDTQDC